VNVNSTAAGGGVAELLQVLLGYAAGAGIATDWLVIRGDPSFFAITKRIHNRLYGVPGDGGPLGENERRVYEQTLESNAAAILDAVRSDDIVIVHDPQPVGLVPTLAEHGAHVIWRCHVGIDGTNEWSEQAWRFLQPYLEQAEAHVFSRAAFAPALLAPDKLAIVPPSIDPFSPKNERMHAARRRSLLAGAGLVDGRGATPTNVRAARVLREGGAPRSDVPLAVQISRWDYLKDMGGVLEAFVEHVPPSTGAHLVLAGPAFAGVADDPEAEAVWEQTSVLWNGLSVEDRRRVDLALLPMDDPRENAYVVNALQRQASVIAQKSLAEGFGLTVSEAMWKSRAVVASSVGGIADQIVDGVSGVLIPDARDLDAFGRAVAGLVGKPKERNRLGRNARRRVKDRFLPDRHLYDYALLVERLLT
jgi:trehalose synthase